jgi:signal transduction histidine kinase
MINNTIKHSRASEANVSLILNGGVLTLDYSDNGCGFIVENALENSSGMGLSNIISRVESIKGEVKIDSNLGQGARFVIKINGVK